MHLLTLDIHYLQGHFAPSSTDSGSTGSIIFDFYWGTTHILCCLLPSEVLSDVAVIACGAGASLQTNRTECSTLATGMELYPRIGGFDLKTWTNCRMGMMSWAVLILCYAAKQHQLFGTIADSMLVCVLLLELYILKFFL